MANRHDLEARARRYLYWFHESTQPVAVKVRYLADVFEQIIEEERE